MCGSCVSKVVYPTPYIDYKQNQTQKHSNYSFPMTSTAHSNAHTHSVREEQHAMFPDVPALELLRLYNDCFYFVLHSVCLISTFPGSL